MAGLYSTTQLIAVMRKVKRLQSFWLNFFPGQIQSETDSIAFDKVSVNYARLAPFVMPNVQGKVLKHEGFARSAIKPAYLKPKDIVDPNMVLPVQPGEIAIEGERSLEQRRNAVIVYLTQQQRAMHENRWEWMAAQATIYGYVDISGENYPAVRVDFGRHAGLTLVSDWSAANATPLDDIYTMRRLANEYSMNGATVQTIVFGDEAWGQFYAKEATRIKDLLMLDQRQGDTTVTKLWDGFEGIEYMGRIVGYQGGGGIDLFVDTRKFTNEAGAQEYLMPRKGVCGVSAAMQGVRCFGAILDAEAGYRAMAMFPKNWVSQDPSVEYLMTQGAPIMVPADPNATFLIKTGS